MLFVLSMMHDCEAKAKDDHAVHTVARHKLCGIDSFEDGLAPTAMMLMEEFPFPT